MSKVNASMKDVEILDFTPAPPDRYRLQIQKIEEKETEAEGKPGVKRQNYNFTVAINDGGEHHGKTMYHNVSIHKKDGTPNNDGLSDMRRFFGAVLGQDPKDDTFPWDEQDSDQLLHQEFMADVTIESYPKNTVPVTYGQRNVFSTSSITGV